MLIEMPKLIGSEKQIKWANSIRNNYLDELDRHASDEPNEKSVKNAVLQLIKDKLETETNSGFWIDNKDFNAYYNNLYKKEKERMTKETLDFLKEKAKAKPAKVYLDASCNNLEKIGGYGIVILHEENIIKYRKKVDQPEMLEGNNISVKMAAAIKAMNLCIEHQIKKAEFHVDLNIFESLTRIESKPEDIMTKRYKESYFKIKNHITIEFVKENKNSEDPNLQLAKELARVAAELKP